jgi:hypothetical protein
MSRLDPVINDSLPDKVYYDIQIANITSNSNGSQLLYFNETRNTPFLQNPDLYYFSIIRLDIDTPTLPVFIPAIDITDPSMNKTIYKYNFVGCDVSGVEHISPTYTVMWQPQDTSLQPPPTFNNDNNYFTCYTYEWFLNLINVQVAQNFKTFLSSVSPTGVKWGLPNSIISPPLFAFNPENNNLFSIGFSNNWNPELYASPTNSAYTVPRPNFGFVMNSSFYNLFDGINALYTGFNGSVKYPLLPANSYMLLPYFHNGSNSGSNYNYIKANLDGSGNIIYTEASLTSNESYLMVQDWSTTPLWSPVSSIVFVSNTLPIVSNQISKPVITANGQPFISAGNGNNDNFAQVITDFTADDGIYKPNLVITPSAQYRLISFTNCNTPLTNIDITVYWKDKLGVLHNFYLGSGCSASIKILFTKKYNDNYK